MMVEVKHHSHKNHQVFNMINARTLHDQLNVFGGVGKGGLFWSILTAMVFCQLIIMQVLAPVFKVLPQSLLQWLTAIGLGAGSLVVALMVKLVSRQSAVVAAGAWLAGGVRAGGSAVAAVAGAVAGRLSIRRWGGTWTRLEAATMEASSLAVEASPLKGAAGPALPLSHSSQEAGPSGSWQRSLSQSPSRQWGCWSTLTGTHAVNASGSGTFSRQVSSVSQQVGGMVELQVRSASGDETGPTRM